MEERIKVKIIGEVQGGQGKLTGIVAMPISEAKRLVDMGYAEPVDGIVISDEETANAMTQAREILDRQSKKIDELTAVLDVAYGKNKSLEELNGKLSQENVVLADKVLEHEKTIDQQKNEIATLKAKPAKSEKK